jgi:hypothetical protein
MTLIEVKVELSRVADSLERLVFLLERLVYPPLPANIHVHQATLDDLKVVTPDDIERMTREQQAFAERYQVVPGSEAMTEALQDWEEAQKRLYGENWQAPEDWKTIFAVADIHRGGGTPAGPAAAQTPDAAKR